MPRLSDANYLKQRTRLGLNWLVYGGDAFIELSSKEQWELHDYFAVTKDLSEAEASAYRVAVSVKFKSLPQRAGRALRKIDPLLTELRPEKKSRPIRSTGRKKHARGPRNVTVKTLAQPEIDVKKLVRALQAMAEEDAKRTAESKDKAA